MPDIGNPELERLKEETDKAIAKKVRERHKEKHRETTILECTKCKWLWAEQYELPMAVGSFVSRMKSWCCPECGASAKKINLLMGERYREAMAILKEAGRL